MQKDYLKDLIKRVKESNKDIAAKQEEAAKQGQKTVLPAEPVPKPVKQAAKTTASAIDESLDIGEDLKKGLEEISKPMKKIVPEEKPIEKSTAEREIEEVGKKIEVDSYGEVKIYQIPGKALLYYMAPVPRPSGSEKAIIGTIKEAATRLITISPYRIRDPEQRRSIYRQKILEILHSAPELHIPERRFDFYAEAVVREMVGYGMIDALVRDDKLEEIMVIGAKKPVYLFHRQYGMMTSNIEFYSEQEIQDLVNRIAREVGRRVDISSPLLDARLADGSRVNASFPPASVENSTLTIRKFREDPYSIIDLINLNTLTPDVAGFLWLAVEGLGSRPANILIAGGAGSGKTTMLNVLASFIPDTERIITIEDTSELNLPLKHWIRMEARPPGLEGRGELTLDILTKNSLRMRPDRIIVGEVRHEEAFSLFTAMNTGHQGSMGTVHANSAQETIIRVTNPPMSVPELMISGLDLILIEHRLHDKKKGTIRRVTEISEVSGVLSGRSQTQKIFERDPIKDIIARTDAPMNYLQALGEFTGMLKKDFEDEIFQRANYLKQLSKKGIRDLKSVQEATQLYILKQKGLD
ncbi:MAG: CpaF family protein [Candidatus ainarchaeum sp.]|nr:CpaF family protein [Candidatus ainarchaeum sp.]